MNEAVLESGGSLLHKFIERNPHVGIFASMAGFGASLLTVVHVLSILVGFVGAIFGCIAGYYTMRCHYRKWQKAKSDDTRV